MIGKFGNIRFIDLSNLHIENKKTKTKKKKKNKKNKKKKKKKTQIISRIIYHFTVQSFVTDE